MTTEIKVLDLSYEAAEDLSNDQYRFVVVDSSTGKVRRPDSEQEFCQGILQNAPGSGEAASVRIIGLSKLQVNAALSIGAFVGPEYVSAADAGKGKDVASNMQFARAVVEEASGAEDDLAGVRLIDPVPDMRASQLLSGTAISKTTVTSKNTAGNVTYTAAELLGGMILRDPNGGARSDVTPTAAQMVAAIAGAAVNHAFKFTIRNTADAAETITLTAGTGVTLSGTMTIAQNNSKRFLAVLTNVTGGSEAVTLYSLGTVVH